MTFLELLSLCLALGFCLAFSYLPSGNQSPTPNSSKALLSTTTLPEATLCLPEFGACSYSVFPFAMSVPVGQVPFCFPLCAVTPAPTVVTASHALTSQLSSAGLRALRHLPRCLGGIQGRVLALSSFLQLASAHPSQTTAKQPLLTS